MTLIFDLLAARTTCASLCEANSVDSFSKYRVHEFGNGWTDGRTNEWTHYASCQSSLAEANMTP